jgi:hypothetical protein
MKRDKALERALENAELLHSLSTTKIGIAERLIKYKQHVEKVKASVCNNAINEAGGEKAFGENAEARARKLVLVLENSSEYQICLQNIAEYEHSLNLYSIDCDYHNQLVNIYRDFMRGR